MSLELAKEGSFEIDSGKPTLVLSRAKAEEVVVFNRTFMCFSFEEV